MGTCRAPCTGVLILTLIVVGIATCGGDKVARAQGQSGVFDRLGPLIQFPSLRGELRLQTSVTGFADGYQVIPRFNVAWDLKDDFGLSSANVFMDVMLRIQLGLLSARVQSYVRDFAGSRHVLANPALPTAQARFSHSGFRFGGDFDLYQWGDSRVGLDIDYDLIGPSFTESIHTLDGKSIAGEPPVTGGFHLYWNPRRYFYGVSGVLEAKARWPLAGAEVTEWELSAGVRSVETAIGSVTFKSGYRHTDLRFTDSQLYNGLEVTSRFDARFYGWFADFVFNY